MQTRREHSRREHSRRDWLKWAALSAAGVVVPAAVSSLARAADSAAGQQPFKISLAEWSLHREIAAKKITNLDFPKIAKEYGIEGVEYVNTMFMDKAKDQKYLAELKKICEGEGVTSVLIMCDREGDLGDADEGKRKAAVENHHKWAEAAKYLGCHSIRVNAKSAGSFDEQIKLAADGLAKLGEFTKTLGLNTIVENHGGLSSNGSWLSAVMKKVNMPNVGTLPDFGNFKISETETYDRYKGVKELMPFAKGVSAKSYDFDDQGNETMMDYSKLLKIVQEAGYHGFVGIEYEGTKLSEREGIKKTLELLKRVRSEM